MSYSAWAAAATSLGQQELERDCDVHRRQNLGYLPCSCEYILKPTTSISVEPVNVLQECTRTLQRTPNT